MLQSLWTCARLSLAQSPAGWPRSSTLLALVATFQFTSQVKPDVRTGWARTCSSTPRFLTVPALTNTVLGKPLEGGTSFARIASCVVWL